MTDPDLSAKRAAAGRRGAAARWGARNQAAPTGDDDLVCGTARELREMAEAMGGNSTPALTRARSLSAAKVAAFKAKRPRLANAKLAGKVVCESLTLPDTAAVPRDAPRLRIVNEDTDTAEVWLYDYIDSWGGYWGISANEVVEQLAQITAPRIDVHINSPGGEVFEGIAIKRALAAHPADVYVCVDSLAASIASVIAMAGDTIGIDESAFMMIHDASGFCYGNAADMTSMADLLDKISGTIAATYASRAGGEADEWRERMLAETWFTADEAIASGLADELLDAVADDPDNDVEASATPATTGGVSPLFAFAAALAPKPATPTPVQFLRAVKEAVDR